MADCIAAELDGVDLGDERLNKRSKVVLECLAANPEASINAACDGWGDTVAAYRFFDNDAVMPEYILRPHRAATLRRVREHPVVLLVQDTSELDFTKHPPKDARCLDKPERFGCYLLLEGGHGNLIRAADCSRPNYRLPRRPRPRIDVRESPERETAPGS